MRFLLDLLANRGLNSGRDMNNPDVFKPREKCSVKINLQTTCLYLRSKCDKDFNSISAEICWLVQGQ